MVAPKSVVAHAEKDVACYVSTGDFGSGIGLARPRSM